MVARMRAIPILVVALLGACAGDIDDRPATVQFITEDVLVPSCGGGECHSAAIKNDGFAFDTVDAVRFSMAPQGGGLGNIDSPDTADSPLYAYLTGATQPRMPYDAPMPDADLALIAKWVELGTPGAQCYPAGVNACDTNTKIVYKCDQDFNLGDIVQQCTTNQKCLVDHCEDLAQ
jgi:hypothetical protein